MIINFRFSFDTDIKFIRKQLKVVGNLIGNLNLKGLSAYQNKLHGLPLQLMSEECVFLLNEVKGAQLVRHDLRSIERINELVKEFEEFDNKLFNDYKILRHQYSVEQIKEKLDIIIKGKAAKDKVSVDQLDKDAILNEQIEKIKPIKESNRPKQLLIQSPWIADLQLLRKGNEDEHRKRLKLSNKISKHSLLRHLVYADLTKKGLYLTKGNKFGSDFLAYANDPLFCHASYLVICLDDQQQLSKTVLQSYSRLSSQVNKHLLLVKFADSNDHLEEDRINEIEYLDELNVLIDKKFDLDYMAIKWRSNS